MVGNKSVWLDDLPSTTSTDTTNTTAYKWALPMKSNGYYHLFKQEITRPSQDFNFIAPDTVTIMSNISDNPQIMGPISPEWILASNLEQDFRFFQKGMMFKTINSANNTNWYKVKSISNDYKTLTIDTSVNSFNSEYKDLNNDITFGSNLYSLMAIGKGGLKNLYHYPNAVNLDTEHPWLITTDGLPISINFDDTGSKSQYIQKTNNIGTKTLYSEQTDWIGIVANIATGDTKSKNFMSGSRTITLIPEANCSALNGTNISFQKSTVTGTDIAFFASNSTIKSSSSNLAVFKANTLIKISGSSNNN